MKAQIRNWMYTLVQRTLFRSGPRKRKEARRISILYKPDAIGDFILFSGALRTLFAAGGSRKWVLITAPAVVDFAKQQFPELEVVAMSGAYDPGLLRSWKRVASLRRFARENKVETLLCFRHVRNGFDHVILNWLNPRESFCCGDSPISTLLPKGTAFFPFTCVVPYPADNPDALPLEVQAHRVLLEAFLGRQGLNVSPDIRFASSAPQERPYVLVFPATRSRLRNYPVDKLAEALQGARSELGANEIKVAGLPEEAEIMEDLLSRIPDLTQVEKLHPQSLTELMRWIQHARAVVSMDSAPAHFAIVFDRPGVFILAAGQWGHFAPWQTRPDQIWLYTRPSCQMCNWICPFEQPRCITDIPAETVTEALRKALTQHP